ncbi:MAG: HlyD family secretion protein [Alphaproteobacteria bacterium]
MDRQPETALREGGTPAEAPPAAQGAPLAARGGWRALLGRRGPRRLVMWGVPLLIVVAGGYAYLTGGRYVSTDDAYVKSGMVTISADVAGRVIEIGVKDSQRVRKGDMLFRLDDRSYRFALERAEANLAQVRLQIEQLRAGYRQKRSELQAARDVLDFQGRQFERSRALVGNKTVSEAQFDQARQAVQTAWQNVAAIEQQIAGILASLGGDAESAADKHPLVLQAQAQLDQARLDLERATVRAPLDGVVSRVESLQVGQYLNVGAAAFALVTARVWIEANFKETELTHMAVGNAATVTVDSYPGMTLTAHVESIGAATGSEFSILPPQNATGNWVKVTQRLPVRIAIDAADPARPLRAGMSATVEVDTKYRRPALALIENSIAGGRK